MNDNTKIATGNDELLTWAVENITAWNDDYTHLRSDSNKVNSLFYTNGTSWRIRDNEWACPMGDDYTDNDDFCTSFSTKTPQVITKQEWQDAKLRNAFNTVLETRHSISKVDNTAQDGFQSQGEALQGLNEVQVGHIHANLMAEYAEVAKTNPEPWKEFEYLCGYYKDGEEVDIWEPCLADLCFRAEVKYRRKPTPPKTMNIGGIVVEAWPLGVGDSCTRLHTVRLNCNGYYVRSADANGKSLAILLSSGKAFSTKEQAQAVADALNKVYNDALIVWKQQ